MNSFNITATFLEARHVLCQKVVDGRTGTFDFFSRVTGSFLRFYTGYQLKQKEFSASRNSVKCERGWMDLNLSAEKKRVSTEQIVTGDLKQIIIFTDVVSKFCRKGKKCPKINVRIFFCKSYTVTLYTGQTSMARDTTWKIPIKTCRKVALLQPTVDKKICQNLHRTCKSIVLLMMLSLPDFPFLLI